MIEPRYKIYKEANNTGGVSMSGKIYMIAGGSVGPYDRWWITDKYGNRKNLVDEGVAVECYFDPVTHTYQPVK